MTHRVRPWGYSGQVGEWSGRIEVPQGRRSPPLAAARYVVERACAVLDAMHRPSRMEVSWGEYDATGEALAFHELEDVGVTSWDVVDAHVAPWHGTRGTAAVSCLFVCLDTCVLEEERAVWVESSAEFQVSFDSPEVVPASAQLAYRTAIDVWLGATYDEHKRPRPNVDARGNAPRLEAMLVRLREITTDFEAGLSQVYPFAIVPTGFRQISVDELAHRRPPRRGAT